MNKISTVEAREQLSEVINRAAYGKERIVLTRRGKDLVAMVPLDDLRLLEELEEQLDLAAVKQAWKAQGKKPLRSWTEAKKKLGLK
jgi:prevent-host-death family protein